MMGKIVLVTGASGGFGALTARALAEAGHTVYAAISRDADVKRAAAAEMEDYSRRHSLSLRAVGLEGNDQRSVDAAVAEVRDEAGPIDVVIHSPGRMALGPAEAFTPYRLSQLYDENVLSSQRVNRAVLPEMRERRDGLLVWVGPAAPDGALPYLGPFFAARAAADRLARSYAVELASFGIETSIVTAGARVSGDASLIYPVDAETMAAYQDLLPGPLDQADRRLARLTPDATSAAGAVVTLVDTPKGGRPLSVIVEPAGGASFRKHPDSYRYHGPGDSPASRDEE
jgi:NAD(P)-dependent dehydrogenase (short-subunit alcohol dehydrogenase family)